MMQLTEMPKYEAYKDSGVDWLGEIPEHWELKSLKRVVQEHGGNGFPIENQGQEGDIPFLKVSDISGDGVYVENCANKVSKNIVNKNKWNIVPCGSLVTAKIGEALRKNHRKIIKENVIIDNNCIAFECNSISLMFNYYLHKVIDFEWFVNPGTIPSISVSKYKAFKVPIPPLSQQTAIANFLDQKTAQIDEAITIKEKQIELLKEHKQILIQQAVTKGLNPDVKMKDSGVDWIGEIPEHWEVKKAKWLFKKSERPVRKEDEIVTCFRDGQVTLRSNRRTEGFTNAIKEHGYQGIRKGDLVIHAMDAFAGAIGVSDSDGKATPVYSACTPKNAKLVNPYFYAYYMRNLALSGFIISLAKGIRERSTDFRFNDFSELFLPIPDYEMQTAIANFLDKKNVQIDNAIALQLQQIQYLKEYKTTLINNAVIGKIKVV